MGLFFFLFSRDAAIRRFCLFSFQFNEAAEETSKRCALQNFPIINDTREIGSVIENLLTSLLLRSLVVWIWFILLFRIIFINLYLISFCRVVTYLWGISFTNFNLCITVRKFSLWRFDFFVTNFLLRSLIKIYSSFYFFFNIRGDACFGDFLLRW